MASCAIAAASRSSAHGAAGPASTARNCRLARTAWRPLAPGAGRQAVRTLAEGRVQRLRCATAATLEADWYISAVPFDRLLDLLPDECDRERAYFANLRHLEISPITSVHLWYDRPITAFAARGAGRLRGPVGVQPRQGGGTGRALSASGGQRRPAVPRAWGRRKCSGGSSRSWPSLFPEARTARLLRGPGGDGTRGDVQRGARRGPVAADAGLADPQPASWPAIGRRPAGPRRWRERCAAATSPPRRCWSGRGSTFACFSRTCDWRQSQPRLGWPGGPGQAKRLLWPPYRVCGLLFGHHAIRFASSPRSL